MPNSHTLNLDSPGWIPLVNLSSGLVERPAEDLGYFHGPEANGLHKTDLWLHFVGEFIGNLVWSLNNGWQRQVGLINQVGLKNKGVGHVFPNGSVTDSRIYQTARSPRFDLNACTRFVGWWIYHLGDVKSYEIVQVPRTLADKVLEGEKKTETIFLLGSGKTSDYRTIGLFFRYAIPETDTISLLSSPLLERYRLDEVQHHSVATMPAAIDPTLEEFALQSSHNRPHPVREPRTIFLRDAGDFFTADQILTPEVALGIVVRTVNYDSELQLALETISSARSIEEQHERQFSHYIYVLTVRCDRGEGPCKTRSETGEAALASLQESGAVLVELSLPNDSTEAIRDSFSGIIESHRVSIEPQSREAVSRRKTRPRTFRPPDPFFVSPFAVEA